MKTGGEDLQAVKWRLILMGCVISALGAILLYRRGISPELLGVLAAGISLLAVGLLWRKPRNTDGVRKDTD
jgi:hypothetical protein